MNYNITFTFLDKQGFVIKAQWKISVTESGITTQLEIVNTPCLLEKDGEEWQICTTADNDDELRAYLEEITSSRISEKPIILKITTEEKDYIQEIIEEFVESLDEDMASESNEQPMSSGS